MKRKPNAQTPDDLGSPQQGRISASTESALAEAEPEITQLVTFLLKDEEFGFDIMSVQEIIRLPKMAKLPHTPEYVEGISNLRGVVLPIFDIRARFGMQREARTDRSRVLVIDVDGKRTGLVVDGVRQVTRVERNEFEPPPAAIRNETTDYIDGVVKLENGKRIIIALDARRVCSFPGSDQNAGEQTGGPESNGFGFNGASAHAEGTASPAGRSEGAAGGGGAEGRGGSVHQLVSFQVGLEEFAFPMEHVREILRVQTPKEVPGAPAHLLGVLTVRGKILPIIDLRRLLRQNSFAADHVAACGLAAANYRSFIQRAGTQQPALQTGSRAESHEALAASERLRSWLASFNSSSQTLTETLAKVRALNEHVSKQAASAGNDDLDASALLAIHGDLATTSEKILALLETFIQQVEGNIREDQRIIVVDSNGLQLGLVVDHVNEVLSVPESAVEAPPTIAHQEGVGLSGVAKLEDGNRLILLLSPGSLLDRHQLGIDAGAVNSGQEIEPSDEQDAVEAIKSAADEELQLVTFLLGKEEYGISIAKIQEIDRLSNITKTPKAPHFVEGVTNLRGEVIPVLSTRSLFALEPKVSDDRTRVIIVDLGGAKTGLVVDSVKEVMSISTRNIAPPPPSISNGNDGQFISGIGKVENGKRMIVLLDVGEVLTRSEQAELATLDRIA